MGGIWMTIPNIIQVSDQNLPDKDQLTFDVNVFRLMAACYAAINYIPLHLQ